MAVDLRGHGYGARPLVGHHRREMDGLRSRGESASGRSRSRGAVAGGPGCTRFGRQLESALRRRARKSETGIPEADSAVAAAKANLDLVQATFKRMNELYEKKSISDQEFDEASAKLKAAQAAYEMARAKRTQTGREAGASRPGSARDPGDAELRRGASAVLPAS